MKPIITGKAPPTSGMELALSLLKPKEGPLPKERESMAPTLQAPPLPERDARDCPDSSVDSEEMKGSFKATCVLAASACRERSAAGASKGSSAEILRPLPPRLAIEGESLPAISDEPGRIGGTAAGTATAGEIIAAGGSSLVTPATSINGTVSTGPDAAGTADSFEELLATTGGAFSSLPCPKKIVPAAKANAAAADVATRGMNLRRAGAIAAAAGFLKEARKV